MAIFELTSDGLRQLSETSFGSEGILERANLQKFLRDQISVLGESLLVIDEEFGDWLDSSRRIDLLCIDSNANLVVVELKRTEDGGYMELQALRYAAMVSEMTFEQAVMTYSKFKRKTTPEENDAQAAILDFLGWDAADEEKFAQDTRIILAAADFGKELTTSVSWLRTYGVDIQCVRMKPYKLPDGKLFVDVQKLIPIPELKEFQTQIGVKKQAERQSQIGRNDRIYRFWAALIEFAKTKNKVHANKSPTTDTWLSGSIGKQGFSINYAIRKTSSQVYLWIYFGPGQAEKSRRAFLALESQKDEIEKAFGGELEWKSSQATSCSIRRLTEGGYASPEDQWPSIHANLVDHMVKLDKALRERVAALTL